MSQWPSDYVELVLEDVKVYPKLHKPVKASLAERLLRKKASPKKMHPNPIDEFSMESVGPNFGIVGDYVNQMARNIDVNMPPIEEPIIIEKMSPSSYMLINGHHRWFAAMRLGVKKIKVKIVNLVHEDDIRIALEKTDNIKSASFDLDEVLLADGNGFSVAAPVKLVGRKGIKERLRVGAVQVIRELKSKGYDVWVYTVGYNSEKYIRALFKLYGISVEGIINGSSRKKDGASEIKKMFDEKYKSRLHIDNEAVTYIGQEPGDFDQFSLENGNDRWADDVLDIVRKIKD